LFNTTGTKNTATGAAALEFNQTGDHNTANGAFALFSSTFAFNNTATGGDALFSDTMGGSNTANGYQALFTNTTGTLNTAQGVRALYSNTFNSNSTAVGYSTLINSTGENNTALGSIAGQQVFTASNVICIGANVLGADVDDSCYIGNIHGQGIDVGTALTVGVDANGKLGTTASSRRFKHDIKPMGNSSETILGLKPVTFHYNSDSKDTPQFGLIAEEVAEVTPELVVRDKNGGMLSVRYDQVNAMLLNEFLKEHRKVEQMQKQIEMLAAGLQKVSAQLELSKAAPQAVLNDRQVN
jgi:Chaperone of endosialidase